MFGSKESAPEREIEPQELQSMLDDGSAMLVDVREADEFAAGHILGAVNLPLSVFHPDDLPPADGRTIVLNCAGGKRSAKALARCAAIQAQVDTHLRGGIGAWIAAGLPVVVTG